MMNDRISLIDRGLEEGGQEECERVVEHETKCDRGEGLKTSPKCVT